jgi:hypothetical protein
MRTAETRRPNVSGSPIAHMHVPPAAVRYQGMTFTGADVVSVLLCVCVTAHVLSCVFVLQDIDATPESSWDSGSEPDDPMTRTTLSSPERGEVVGTTWPAVTAPGATV